MDNHRPEGNTTWNQHGHNTVTGKNAWQQIGNLTIIHLCGKRLRVKTVLLWLYIFEWIGTVIALAVGAAAAAGMTDPDQFNAKATVGKLVYNLFVVWLPIPYTDCYSPGMLTLYVLLQAAATVFFIVLVAFAEHAYNTGKMHPKWQTTWLWLRLALALVGLIF
jgi:hypothetical protein